MSRRPVVVFVVVAVLGGMVLAWRARKPAGDGPEARTPYRNARPGVKFVGDRACVKCHQGIARTYSEHPMGRSLATIASAPAAMRADAPELFRTQGFVYGSETREGRVFHRESRLDANGRTIASVEGEVKYALGSGTRAVAFVIEREGYLFQSPITWYAQSRKWDLAPGYERANPHLERPITAYCLYCHANQIEHVPGTLNKFKEPILAGHAIGCERCHGPGELHVRHPMEEADLGPNIVNPRKLEPVLREAVCQQCHLLGEAGVIDRPGRGRFDYRPGLPLTWFERVYVPRHGNDPTHENGGHVEQMTLSRCYTESQGALGCISCHDPHALPAPETKTAYYRARCLECHADRGCSLPAPSRLEKSASDDCTACHMPRRTTEDVTHLATTIHRITRNRPGGAAPVVSARETRPDQMSLVLFNKENMTAQERDDAKRDLGVILSTRGKAGATEALPLLERALRTHPEDVEARVAEGYVLAALGRSSVGLERAEAARRLDPERESVLVAVATLAQQSGKHEEAIDAWRKVIAIDPYRSEHHAGLATLLVQAGQWSGADASARKALALNPASMPARLVRIQVEVHDGQTARARAEFETLLEFDPPDRPGLARWFHALR